MKKTLNIVLFALMLSGCYKDKGNYEYTLDTMNEITSVTFSPSIAETANGKVIEVQQALGEDDLTRRIDVNVEQTLLQDLEELDFNWFLTYAGDNGKTVNDTINSKGFLEVELPVGKEMVYNVFLQIYDRTTTLSHYSAFKIMTRPVFKNSLFVLHGEEGNRKLGNIEVIGSETNVYTDIQSVIPGNIYSNAIGLAYTTYYDIAMDNVTGKWIMDETNALTVFNNGSGTMVYNPYGMTVKFVSGQIFKPESEEFVFKKMVQTGDPSNFSQYKVALSENGEVYIGNVVHALYRPGYACEVYDNDPLHQSDYQITAAAITHNRFVFWDAKNKRFLYSAKNSNGIASDEQASQDRELMSTNPMLDAHVDFSGLTDSPEDMTAVMGYVNYRDNYEEQSAYFIFKDENTGSFYRYQLTALATGGAEKVNSRSDGKRSDEAKPAFSLECQKMKNFSPTNEETVTYNSWFTTNNLFYAEGNKVYKYNVSNGDNIVVYEAPEGYTVTTIKFRNEDSSSFGSDLGRYLSIGLYNGSVGAVAEIKFNTAADIDEEFATLFYEVDDMGKSWGRIKDFQFVREYIYKMD